jgi:hypothetical protein
MSVMGPKAEITRRFNPCPLSPESCRGCRVSVHLNARRGNELGLATEASTNSQHVGKTLEERQTKGSHIWPYGDLCKSSGGDAACVHTAIMKLCCVDRLSWQSKPDMTVSIRDARFTPESGLYTAVAECPLCASFCRE